MPAHRLDDSAFENAPQAVRAGRYANALAHWGSPVKRHGWAYALLVVLACTGICALMTPYFDLANLIMVYLAGVVYAALRFGQSASVVAVLSSIFLFDLIFVPPRWSLNPTNTQHLFTLAVMLLVGLLISRLVAHARTQALVADARARREHALNELARQLAAARSPGAIAAGLAVAVRSTFDAPCELLLPDIAGKLADPNSFCLGLQAGLSPTHATLAADAELQVAQQAFDQGQSAGAGAPCGCGKRAVPAPAGRQRLAGRAGDKTAARQFPHAAGARFAQGFRQPGRACARAVVV